MFSTKAALCRSCYCASVTKTPGLVERIALFHHSCCGLIFSQASGACAACQSCIKANPRPTRRPTFWPRCRLPLPPSPMREATPAKRTSKCKFHWGQFFVCVWVGWGGGIHVCNCVCMRVCVCVCVRACVYVCVRMLDFFLFFPPQMCSQSVDK